MRHWTRGGSGTTCVRGCGRARVRGGAHADVAEGEALGTRGVERRVSEGYIAVRVVEGLATEAGEVAGAHHGGSLEAMMGDGKALQAGTSHHLGENFAE